MSLAEPAAEFNGHMDAAAPATALCAASTGALMHALVPAPAPGPGSGAAAAGVLAPTAAPAPPAALTALASACVELYHICAASGTVGLLRAAGSIMPSEVVPGQQPLASPHMHALSTVPPTRKRPRTVVIEREVGGVGPAAWPDVDQNALQVPAGMPAGVGAGNVCLRGVAAAGLLGRELERLRGYTFTATGPDGGKWVLQFIPDTRQQEWRPLAGSAGAAGRAAADSRFAPSGACAGCACASGAGAQGWTGAIAHGAAAAGLDAAGGGAAGVTLFPLPTLKALQSMQTCSSGGRTGTRRVTACPSRPHGRRAASRRSESSAWASRAS